MRQMRGLTGKKKQCSSYHPWWAAQGTKHVLCLAHHCLYRLKVLLCQLSALPRGAIHDAPGGFLGLLDLPHAPEFWQDAVVAHVGAGLLFLAVHAIGGEILHHHKALVTGFRDRTSSEAAGRFANRRTCRRD